MGKPNEDLTPLASGSGSKENESKEGSRSGGRPFKKARYLWQIKGKSHLRDGRRGRPIARGKGSSQLKRMLGHEQQPEVESKEEETEAMEVEAEDAQVAQQSPADVSRCVRNFLHSLNHSTHNLRRWQTKHLAKGIIDNAINKVLEEMGFVPYPATDPSHLPAPEQPTHPSESEGELQQNVENEAVSAAIENHGLHRRRCQHHHHHFFHSSSDSDSSTDSDSTDSPSEPKPLILPCRCFPNRRRRSRLDLDSLPPAMFIDPEFMRSRLLGRKRRVSTDEDDTDSGCDSDVPPPEDGKKEEPDPDYPDADPGEILDKALTSAIESKGLVILG